MDIGIKGMDNLCKILERVFYSEIPLTKNMGVRVTEYDESLVVLTAPLKPNINIHGTAFAGSLYSLAALAGWGLLYLKLMDEQLRGHIVLGEGKIVYRRPVKGKIEARCFLGESEFKTFRENFRTDKGARIHLRSDVLSGSVVAASYDGDYRVQG